MKQSPSASERIHRVVPKLERVLAHKSRTSELGEDLQLRNNGQCGLVTAALQLYCLEAHNLETERLKIEVDDDRLHGPNSRRQTHAILRDEKGVYIDPTYSQFYSLIGLTPELAKNQNLSWLYPPVKVATFSKNSVKKYINRFSSGLYLTSNVYEDSLPRDTISNPPFGALRDLPEKEVRSAVSSIWNLDQYEPYEENETHEGVRTAARKIVDSIRYLEAEDQ